MTNESNNFENFRKQTESANVVPVVETLTADLLTPLAVYLKLAAHAVNSFLLESVEGDDAAVKHQSRVFVFRLLALKRFLKPTGAREVEKPDCAAD